MYVFQIDVIPTLLGKSPVLKPIQPQELAPTMNFVPFSLKTNNGPGTTLIIMS